MWFDSGEAWQGSSYFVVCWTFCGCRCCCRVCLGHFVAFLKAKSILVGMDVFRVSLFKAGPTYSPRKQKHFLILQWHELDLFLITTQDCVTFCSRYLERNISSSPSLHIFLYSGVIFIFYAVSSWLAIVSRPEKILYEVAGHQLILPPTFSRTPKLPTCGRSLSNAESILKHRTYSLTILLPNPLFG